MDYVTRNTWAAQTGVTLAQGLGKASSFISGRAREPGRKLMASTVRSVLKIVFIGQSGKYHNILYTAEI